MMWNLFLRLGMVLSTLMIAKQVIDHVWPNEIQPTRLYRPHQVARYLGINSESVLELIRAGDLSAKWLDGNPVVLGVSILNFLGRN